MTLRKIIYYLPFLLLLSCSSADKTEGTKPTYSGDIERHYVTPTRVITHTPQVTGIDYLLKEGKHQAHTVNIDLCILKNKGDDKAFFVLDFGKE